MENENDTHKMSASTDGMFPDELSSKSSNTDTKFHLKTTIGLWRGMSVICGIIIGAGIFITPGGVLRASNGSIGLSLIVWAVGGFIAMLSALCYCELTTSIRESGGNLTFFTLAYGPSMGFMLIWVSTIAPMSEAMGLLALGRYSIEMFTSCPPSSTAVKVVALLFMFLFLYLNSVTVKGILKMELICTSAKFLAMLAIALGGIVMLIKGNPVGRHNFQHAFDSNLLETLDLKSFSLAFYQVLWPYSGWSALSYVAEEVKDPGKTVPLATIGALLLVIVNYLLINIGFYSVLTVEEIMTSKAVAAIFAERLFGSAGIFVPVLVCVCIIGGYNGGILVVSRASFAAARRGLLPPVVAMAHINRYTPSPAFLVNSLGSFVLISIGDFDTILESLGFLNWTFYGLNALAVLVLRKKYPNLSRPYKAPTFVPVIVVVLCLFFMVSPLISNPRPLYLYSLIYIGSSFLVYYFLVRRGWNYRVLESATLFLQKLFQVAPTDWQSHL